VGLYERLIGPDPAKIPVHNFMAALGEFERGKVTRAQVITAFELSGAEGTELDALTALVRTPLESYSLGGRVTLTNVGAAYDTNVDSQSLPFLYLQCAGITRVDIELRVRKVGTGTQDWQLFDDTSGVAAIGPGALTTGSLSDTNGAGDHTLVASRTFAAPLTPGVRKMRLRARSSVPADDPVFLAAALLLFRVDTITSVVLHEVLLLGEGGHYTLAQVKTRLGV
jgi:hypothetical protein